MSAEQPLDILYPFLKGTGGDDNAGEDGLLESIHAKARHSVEIKQQFFDANAKRLLAMALRLAQVFRSGGRLFAMGNGGSSCDAAHVCVEFQHPVTAGRPSLPAFNLTMDCAMNSAVANDVGVSQVFARQLEAHGAARDALLGFSTSGNSNNLMAAYRRARRIGMTTLGLAGNDGGEMAASGLLDHCLVVPTESIHRVQETHVACYHILWDLVHTLLADTRGRLWSGQNAMEPAADGEEAS